MESLLEGYLLLMNFLISGAGGFIGNFLVDYLRKQNYLVTLLHRENHINVSCKEHYDCLVHLAARAHVMHETATNVYQAYAEVNIDYTMKVAELAKQLQVKRFIYLSSVKVNGESTKRSPFTEQNAPSPEDAYGQTKYEAENALKDYFAGTSIELVIIRPPLIYGAGVKANFKNLISLCNKPIPLPFGAINNKRSLVYLDNLIDFIELCCSHPKAANQTFLVSDDQDVSTTELIKSIRIALNKPVLLLPFPQEWLVNTLKMLGKAKLATRLFGNLQVDISKAKNLLGWRPPFTFEQGIQKTVDAYQQER